MLSNFQKMTLGYLKTFSFQEAVVECSITGAGYVTYIVPTLGNDRHFEIVVDGISKGFLKSYYNSDGGWVNYNCLIRFNTSFIIKKDITDSDYVTICYILD